MAQRWGRLYVPNESDSTLTGLKPLSGGGENRTRVRALRFDDGYALPGAALFAVAS